MKNILLLSTLISFSLFAPSQRAPTGTKPKSSAFLPQKPLVVKSIPTAGDKSTAATQLPASTDKKSFDDIQIAQQSTCPDLFYLKFEQSTLVTHRIIDYFFSLTQAAMLNGDNDLQEKEKNIRAIFNGLRYPIYRHLRDIISACADENSAFCGFIEASIIKNSQDPKIKEEFLSQLQTLGKTLKEFKMYHIDKQLAEDIENHLNNLEPLLKKMENSTLKDLGNMVTSFIDSHYFSILESLQDHLNNPEIKGVLPYREGITKYGVRQGYKASKKVGTFIVGKTITYATSIGMQKLLEYLTLSKNPFSTQRFKNLNKEYYAKISNILKKVLPIKKTETSSPVSEQNSQNSVAQFLKKTAQTFAPILKPADKPILLDDSYTTNLFNSTETTNNITARPILSVDGLKNLAKKAGNLVVSTAQYAILPYASIVDYAGTLIQESSQRSSVDNIQYGMAYFTWPKMVEKVATFVNTNILLNAYFYLNQKSTPALIKKADQNLDILFSNNTKLLHKSSAFSVFYMEHLVKNIINTPQLSLDIVVKILQSAQIELFRHRRFVISEIANKKSFTNSYIGFLHGKYIARYNSLFSPEELSGTREPLTRPTAEAFEVTEKGKDIAEMLQNNLSTDKNNDILLAKLAGPVSLGHMRLCIERFEECRLKIAKELKSFGAQSNYQLVQQYWLSTINKEYVSKLKNHLGYLDKEMKALEKAEKEFLLTLNKVPLKYKDNKQIIIKYPFISPIATYVLDDLITENYIQPLTDIVTLLNIEEMYEKLPENNKWYIKYPLIYTKLGVNLNKYAVKEVVDTGLIPLAVAYLTGGATAFNTQLASKLSFSGLASTLFGIDITSTESILWTGGTKLLTNSGSINSLYSADTFTGKNAKAFINKTIKKPLDKIINQ